MEEKSRTDQLIMPEARRVCKSSLRSCYKQQELGCDGVVDSKFAMKEIEL